MTVIIDPIAEAIRPISALPRVADARLWRRRTRWLGGGTSLTRFIASIGKDNIIVCVIGSGMIEDGFLGSRTRIRRIKKGCDRLRRRGTDTAFYRGAAHAEEESAE
jgi:hypothetical protein